MDSSCSLVGIRHLEKSWVVELVSRDSLVFEPRCRGPAESAAEDHGRAYVCERGSGGGGRGASRSLPAQRGPQCINGQSCAGLTRSLPRHAILQPTVRSGSRQTRLRASCGDCSLCCIRQMAIMVARKGRECTQMEGGASRAPTLHSEAAGAAVA